MNPAPLTHSAGICLIDGRTRPDTSDYSFAIADGQVLDGYGWGATGEIPEVAVNPIDGPVHTVYVFDLSDGSKAAILSLAREHVARYRQCYIECAPYEGDLAQWVGSGMPEPIAVPVNGKDARTSTAWVTETGEDQ